MNKTLSKLSLDRARLSKNFEEREFSKSNYKSRFPRHVRIQIFYAKLFRKIFQTDISINYFYQEFTK